MFTCVESFAVAVMERRDPVPACAVVVAVVVMERRDPVLACAGVVAQPSGGAGLRSRPVVAGSRCRCRHGEAGPRSRLWRGRCRRCRAGTRAPPGVAVGRPVGRCLCRHGEAGPRSRLCRRRRPVPSGAGSGLSMNDDGERQRQRPCGPPPGTCFAGHRAPGAQRQRPTADTCEHASLRTATASGNDPRQRQRHRRERGPASPWTGARRRQRQRPGGNVVPPLRTATANDRAGT